MTLDSETEAGGICELELGQAPHSTAGDSLADSWKLAYKLDLQAPGVAKADFNGDGYCNLEKFANDLVAPPPH